MRKGLVVAILLGVVGSSCAGGASQRTARVDYQHDEFASHYWRYFPGTIYAHPGDELVFNQQWTGEPHTVTFGTIVDRAIPRIEALEKKFEKDEPETEAEIAAATKEYEEAAEGLPVFDPYLDLGSKAAIQPCYLQRGTPPQGATIDRTAARDGGSTCPRREQPAFNGKQSYYSSGFIPPEGPSGNAYRMPIANDITPGTYTFYCVIHYPDMQGRLVVKPPSEDLPSQAEMNVQARKEIEGLATPLRRAFAEARANRAKDPNGESISLPIAGYHSGEEYTVAVDEFVPKVWRVRANEPVTWTITGAHTISFDVPEYIPIYEADEDGTIKRNPVVDRAAGGSPNPPPVDFTKGPVSLDGDTWDGSRFVSSGLLGSEPVSRYTLRVSKAGRYRYACLVHPTMVATLEVTPD